MKLTLKALRVNKKMTQDEAAAQVGVSKATWFNWENGISHPTQPNIQKIINLFKVTYEDIIF